MRKKNLFKKFIHNKATEDEIRELFQYMGDWDTHELEKEIQQYEHISSEHPLPSKVNVKKFLAVAAAVALVISVSLMMYFGSDPKNIETPITDVTGISDSSTVITFSDGRVLNLKEEHILYIGDGEVSTSYKDNLASSDLSYVETKFDRITTPIGGQTTFILPDSTKVKLNGNSKLKFANHLVDGRRYVELEGEAFFDVRKSDVPFVVQTKNQHVKVLGTSFNVSAYDNDPLSAVALISGKVALTLSNDFVPSATTGQLLLHPGDVGIVHPTSGKLYLSDDEAEDYMAWIRGRFDFDNESLADITRRLGRWYNVEIIFKENVEKLKFTGSISRSETIQSVLDKLALTKKIKYSTKERRIEIMKN